MAPLDLSLMHVRSRTSPRIERPGSLRVSDACQAQARGDARRQASEKPRGRKPRGKFAPAVVSGYGDLAPVFDLIFDFRTGETAERVP